MNIVLQGADFSDNNIGRITVITDFVKNAIALSDNSSMTSGMKYALNDFFGNLGANDNSGIWSKVKKIYLPMIAGNLSKAMVDYKAGVVDATPDATWQLRNKGLIGVSDNKSEISGLTVVNPYTINPSQSCVLWCDMENLTLPTSQQYILNVMLDAEGQQQLVSGTVYVNGNYEVSIGKNTSSAALSTVRNAVNTKGVHGVSVNGNDVVFINGSTFTNNTITGNTLKDTVTSVTSNRVLGSNNGLVSPLPSKGMIIIADNLTRTELENLTAWTNKLIMAVE